MASAYHGLRILRRQTMSVFPSAPRPERRGCQVQLIAKLLGMAGAGCSVEDASLRPWCSATFVGAQHRITVRIKAAQPIDHARVVAKAIEDGEFNLSGHIVADVRVADVVEVNAKAVDLVLEVLTIEDR